MSRISAWTFIYLYWSDLTKKIRFVLVEYGGTQSILACSSLFFSPEEIIKVYSYRYKIEVTFTNLKHLLKAFDYRFWSKNLSVLPLHKKGINQRVMNIAEKKEAVKKIEVIEGYVNFCTIALGILQILCINFNKEINQINGAYKRTRSCPIPTEEDTKNLLRSLYFYGCLKTNTSFVFQVIKSKAEPIKKLLQKFIA